MNDAAFGAVTSQLGDAALLETIRHRVEAAGTSFYWAMRLLPHHRRNGMYAVYAFCREVDDIADGERPVQHKLRPRRMARRDRCPLRGTSAPPHRQALGEPVLRYRLHRRDFLAVIEGWDGCARRLRP
jgi:phytoene synthase